MPEITEYFNKSTKCESATPPNMESHNVDKRTHLRVTGVTMDRLWAHYEPKYDQLLVSTEISKGGHQHLHCIISDVVYARDKKSNKFREDFIATFQIKGNGGYSISKVKDDDHCVSYVLKEGEYKAKGYDEVYLAKRKSVSYLKYSKEAIASDLDNVNNQYMKNELDDAGWVREYIRVKHSYKQYNINRNRTTDLLQNLKMKKDSKYREAWIGIIVNKISLEVDGIYQV